YRVDADVVTEEYGSVTKFRIVIRNCLERLASPAWDCHRAEKVSLAVTIVSSGMELAVVEDNAENDTRAIKLVVTIGPLLRGVSTGCFLRMKASRNIRITKLANAKSDSTKEIRGAIGEYGGLRLVRTQSGLGVRFAVIALKVGAQSVSDLEH